MANRVEITEDKDKLDLLIKALSILNLLPTTGNGRVEFIFQDGTLLDTIRSDRIRVNVKLSTDIDKDR
jgi:hypothetical protein